MTEARRILARDYAKSILNGSLSPYEGARKIWWELWSDCTELVELEAFAGLASEIGDDDSAQHRRDYESDIPDGAKRLLAGAK